MSIRATATHMHILILCLCTHALSLYNTFSGIFLKKLLRGINYQNLDFVNVSTHHPECMWNEGILGGKGPKKRKAPTICKNIKCPYVVEKVASKTVEICSWVWQMWRGGKGSP